MTFTEERVVYIQNIYLYKFCVLWLQEKSVDEHQATAKDADALREKALADSTENHSKELDDLNAQFEKAKQEFRVSQDEREELKKRVEELMPFKEKAEVRPKTCAVLWMQGYPYAKINL